MEVTVCLELAPLPFPNLSLIVSYPKALSYVQGRLKMLGSGGLKPFCATHQLTYTNVINLKNGKLKREESRFVQRLLSTLAVPTELVHYPPGSKTSYFLLPDAQALAGFQSQLQLLTALE